MRTDPLAQMIRDRIAREGPISFAAFMEMALYQPGLGYYMSSPVQFGSAGDYYTSPRLHPVFSRLLAIQIDEMHQAMGRPGDFVILEIGAGQAILAGGIIDCLLEHMNWDRRWTYRIVERNPQTLKEQRKTLKPYSGLVEW